MRFFPPFTPSKRSPAPIKRALKALLIVVILASLALLLLLVLLLDQERRYISAEDISSLTVKEASQFVKRVSKQLLNTRSTTTLKGSALEINSTIALANRSYRDISGYVNIDNEQAHFFFSLKAKLLGRDVFVNAHASLLESEHGIVWHSAQVGDVVLGKTLANWLFRRSVHVLIGKRYGQNVLRKIGPVVINNETLAVDFTAPADFHTGFAMAAQRVSTYVGQSISLDTARVQHYLEFLVDMTRALPQQNVSLAEYLEPLLKNAKQQSHALGLPPEDENLYALYALAIQAAPGAFKHFVAGLKVHRLNATYQPTLTLSGRHDLAKHFIYSSALKILADRGVSFSLGETKEMIDASTGGSGFSFADIAADRAGITFAEVASNQPQTAQLLQEFAVLGMHERDFFPSLEGLPEGLTNRQFSSLYSNTDSEIYNDLITQIDQRIRKCAILGLAQDIAAP